MVKGWTRQPEGYKKELGLTLSTSALFCRLLLKGSRVRQETTTSSGCRQRKMAASTMALASRGSVEMWARRCPRVVRYSRWSSTPATAQLSVPPMSHSMAQPHKASTHQSLGARSRPHLLP
jgi:hypothetical protein